MSRCCSSPAAASIASRRRGRPPGCSNAAQDTGTVTAELRLVPNQPIVFKDDPTRKPRSEDDFIAYTWDKYLAHRRREMAGASADDQERRPGDGCGDRVCGIASRAEARR